MHDLFKSEICETFPFRTVDRVYLPDRSAIFIIETNRMRLESQPSLSRLHVDEYFSEECKLKIRWRGYKRRFAGFHKTDELQFSTVVFSLNKDKGMTFIVCLTPFSISTMRLSHENTGTK